MDSEGYCETKDHFYIADEYGPHLYKFENKTYKLVKTFKSGNELPTEWLDRKLNRGLEGLACENQTAYLMLQSPLPKEDFISIGEFDLKKEKIISLYKYPVDKKTADKVGDIALIKDKRLLIIEQNGKIGKFKSVRALYEVDLAKVNSEGLLEKKLIADLNELNLDQFEKIEGLAIVDAKTIALVVDNDFALDPNIEKINNQIKINLKPDAGSFLILVRLNQALY